jgi:hypothetical protein
VPEEEKPADEEKAVAHEDPAVVRPSESPN